MKIKGELKKIIENSGGQFSLKGLTFSACSRIPCAIESGLNVIYNLIHYIKNI